MFFDRLSKAKARGCKACLDKDMEVYTVAHIDLYNMSFDRYYTS